MELENGQQTQELKKKENLDRESEPNGLMKNNRQLDIIA